MSSVRDSAAIAAASTRDKYITFYRSIGDILPCADCGLHYKNMYNEDTLRIALDGSDDELSKWVYDMHDAVNTRLGKKSPSYTEVKMKYTGYEAKYDHATGVCGSSVAGANSSCGGSNKGVVVMDRDVIDGQNEQSMKVQSKVQSLESELLGCKFWLNVLIVIIVVLAAILAVGFGVWVSGV